MHEVSEGAGGGRIADGSGGAPTPAVRMYTPAAAPPSPGVAVGRWAPDGASACTQQPRRPRPLLHILLGQLR